MNLLCRVVRIVRMTRRIAELRVVGKGKLLAGAKL